MRIDGCGSGNVAVPEPFLDFLHAYAFGIQETCAAVTEIVKADSTEAVLFQKVRKVGSEVARLQKIPNRVYIDIVQIIRVVGVSEELLVFGLPDLQPEKSIFKRLYQG